MVGLPRKEEHHKIPLIQTHFEEDFTEVENAYSRIFQETRISCFQINTKVNATINKMLPDKRPAWTDSNE